MSAFLASLEASALLPTASVALHAVCAQCETLLAYSLPLLAWAITVRRSARERCASVLVLSCVLLGFLARRPEYLQELVGVGLAYAYHLGAGTVAHRLVVRGSAASWPKDALFAFLLVLFIAVPALPFRALGITPALIIGWLLVLASYSYAVDSAREAGERSLRSFLFFVLVDPSLVYPVRARRSAEPTARGRALARMGRGFLSLAAGQALLVALPELPSPPSEAARVWLPAHALLVGALCFLGFYWLRAGVVETKIALLELSGYTVRAAYLRPYSAKSPRDFWARWNLYVGQWARRYVFSPLALGVARKQRALRLPALAPQAIAVVATFLAIGALHDVLIFAGQSQSDLRFVRGFLIAALGLLAWELCVLLARRLPRVLHTRGSLLAPVRVLGMATYVTAIATTLGAV